MKNDKTVGLFLLISIICQNIYFSRYGDLFFSFTFTYGIKLDESTSIIPLYILVLLSPVFFMHFYFSESLYKLTHGYGKLYLIRQYSKSKLILKEFFKAFGLVLVITAFQLLIAFLFKNSGKSVDLATLIKSLFAYVVGVFAVVLLQMMFEFYFKPQQAALICCIYSLISYCVGYFLTDNIIIKTLFFPCLMFCSENGTSDNIIYYIASVCIMAVICLCIIIYNINKFKKTDIF